MSRVRHLDLAWSSCEGQECLRVGGWTAAEVRELNRLLPAEFGRRLAVLPSALVDAGARPAAMQPLTGRFVLDGDAICFIPRFPFVDGIGYALLIYPDAAKGSGEPQVQTIERPERAGAPTTDVAAIYPTASALPVNQLKFYVHFSGPMSEGHAARAVHIHREDNDEPLTDVFLAMQPELWDRGRRRLTLLLDPGRIKRGLVPNAEAGYPLVEGVPIVLRIDAAFRDAVGRPLRKGAERRYAIGPPVRARLDPTDWQYRRPRAGSLEPFTVRFDRPLDHALLGHCLRLHDVNGEPVAGERVIGEGERSWRFEPLSPWESGRYSLVIEPRLEDLAGNSLTRVFDRDLQRTEDTPSEARPMEIGFTCDTPGSREAPPGARGGASIGGGWGSARVPQLKRRMDL